MAAERFRRRAFPGAPQDVELFRQHPPLPTDQLQLPADEVAFFPFTLLGL
jgi:hypothetical protein